MTNDSFVFLRNTVSGVTTTETLESAAHILAHPHFGKYHEVADSPKNEVLSQPHSVDEDGNRENLKKSEDKK